MSKKLNIIIQGFDVTTLENAVQTIQQKLLQLKLNFVALPLPTKIEKISVARSPHKHKESSGQQFEKRIHRRLVQIFEPTANILNHFPNLPASHNLEISMKFIDSVAK